MRGGAAPPGLPAGRHSHEQALPFCFCGTQAATTQFLAPRRRADSTQTNSHAQALDGTRTAFGRSLRNGGARHARRALPSCTPSLRTARAPPSPPAGPFEAKTLSTDAHHGIFAKSSPLSPTAPAGCTSRPALSPRSLSRPMRTGARRRGGRRAPPGHTAVVQSFDDAAPARAPSAPAPAPRLPAHTQLPPHPCVQKCEGASAWWRVGCGVDERQLLTDCFSGAAAAETPLLPLAMPRSYHHPRRGPHL